MRFSIACFAIVAFYSTLVSGQPTSIWDILLPSFLLPSASQTTCKLRVYQDDKPLGYLSSTKNSFGEYGILQESPSGALSVTFSASRSNSRELSLRVVEAGGDISMFGGIIGFTTSNDNLAAGSHHYAYIGLTPQTPSGSVPVKGANSFDQVQDFERKVQSAIWSYNSATRQFSPQWVNTNMTTPKNYLLYVADEKTLVFTADKIEFQKVLNLTSSEVTLHCA
ncbi:unnamed protein product [Rhizoctonia solani]|uniref:Uncharacterized protein n=1 Tax=Rhizoctonia solani TaxID=456999 RepID=A0A8H2XEG4_9AGAM|nr:unnamed protein product [Rhizoctonia solani]